MVNLSNNAMDSDVLNGGYSIVKIGDRDKRKLLVSKLLRTGIGRLDSESFIKRCNYLREIFMDPQRRHVYEWTILEKKILMLDWYHNPSLYENWRPSETEDMMNRFFSNIIYNYSQLSIINIGTTIIFCRLLDEYIRYINGIYQYIVIILRYNDYDGKYYDELKIGLIYRGDEKYEFINNFPKMLLKQPNLYDYQCIFDGISILLYTKSINEYEILEPCDNCKNKFTYLYTPKITFDKTIISFEITTTLINGNKII